LLGRAAGTSGKVAFAVPHAEQVAHANTFASSAPAANAPLSTIKAPAQSPAAQGRTATPAARWLGHGLLVLRLQPALPTGASVRATSLWGTRLTLKAVRRGAVDLLGFLGQPPGWYQLDLPQGSVAVLWPLPQGAARSGTLQGSWSCAGGRVVLQSVRFSARGTTALFFIGSGPLPNIALRGTAAGVESPLVAALRPAAHGMVLRLTFDPQPPGAKTLSFSVTGVAGGPTILTVPLGP